MTEGLGIAARGFDLAEVRRGRGALYQPRRKHPRGHHDNHLGISRRRFRSDRGAPIPILTINNPDGQELVEQA